MSAASPWLPRPLAIAERAQETADTFTLRLEPGDCGFAFAPGQFNMIYAFGVGEAAISISGDPTRPETLVHTIRAVGTVTRALATLDRGAAVGIRGPYGSAWPVEHALGGDLLIIAGGLGLAPLRPVVYDVLARRALFGHVVVLYGARSPADLLYTRELDAWIDGGVHVQVTVDHAGTDWVGSVGTVPSLIDGLVIDPARTIALVCGPEVMMRFCLRALATRGLAADRVHVSLERNMKCAVGLCGHCQLRESFVCKDGPVVRADRIAPLLDRREI